jgi:pilus assembly protein CpaE
MLRTIVATEDTQVAQAIEGLALDSQLLQVLRAVESFPTSEYDVGRLLSQYDPELVVLEAKNPESAMEIGMLIRTRASGVGVVVVGRGLPQALEAPYKKAGIEFLAPPLTPEMLILSARNSIRQARTDLCRGMLVFMPSKAGSGASTIALNVASAFGRGLSKKAFLLEADLHSGILSLSLNVKPKATLIDVLHDAGELNYSVWEQKVIHVQALDLLPTDRSKKLPLPSWLDYYDLMKFVIPKYDRVVVDLPEVVNDATAELVHYALAVYVVCTSELPSLTLAEQRLKELAAKGLPSGRAQIIVNRWHKGNISVREVEDLLKAKVAAVFQNDYRTVHKSTLAGSAVKLDSDLGKAFLNFAKKLDGPQTPDKGPSQGSLSLLNALRSSRA